jgi:hypothetical protein
MKRRRWTWGRCFAVDGPQENAPKAWNRSGQRGSLMRKLWAGQAESIHLFVFWSFAVAQPLYDLVGRNAEFLVAMAPCR